MTRQLGDAAPGAQVCSQVLASNILSPALPKRHLHMAQHTASTSTPDECQHLQAAAVQSPPSGWHDQDAATMAKLLMDIGSMICCTTENVPHK